MTEPPSRMAPARPIPRWTRLPWIVPVAVAVLLLAVPVYADSNDDPQSKLEHTRDRMDAVAKELDLLNASDADLQARLDDLDAGITEHKRSVAERSKAADAADARVADLLGRVRVARAEVDRQQAMVNERVVDAYIEPDVSEMELLFDSSDYNEFHTKQVLVAQIADYDRDVLADLDVARTRLETEQSRAAKARSKARSLRSDAEDALRELKDERAQQAAVRDALDERIAAVHSESDALAADEAQLVSIIQARHRADPPPTTVAPTATPGEPPGSTEPGSPSTTSASTTPGSTVPGAPAFQWPVRGPVTSPFGMRWGKMHNGIDIGVPTGTEIGASAAGEVFFAGWLGGYGNCVLIDHGSGFTTLYAHQSALLVSEGQEVGAGETIGLSGSTGHSTGPHLHFEVRVWDVPQDPMLYLP